MLSFVSLICTGAVLSLICAMSALANAPSSSLKTAILVFSGINTLAEEAEGKSVNISESPKKIERYTEITAVCLLKILK
ncbi:MAG: hypothetical protein BWY62_00133 [Firmicutes bacterium ADurb.Bin356]|nr:MAG: hypothetical protein BWY62_00133 [Firmicutes bacterium ADurb.Bin356]